MCVCVGGIGVNMFDLTHIWRGECDMFCKVNTHDRLIIVTVAAENSGVIVRRTMDIWPKSPIQIETIDHIRNEWPTIMRAYNNAGEPEP